MPQNRFDGEGYIYTLPHLNRREERCSKQCKKQTKYSCIFTLWFALTVFCIYFGVHYHILHEDIVNCKTEIGQKNQNESVLMANIGELKQKNAELNQELKTTKKSLQHTEELFANAQDKIEIYLKTIKELKENLNVKISTDFLTNEYTAGGASIASSTSYYCVVLISMFYYVVIR